MAETIVLDPSEVSTGRTQFDITAWVAGEGVDWGDSAIEQYLAQAHRGQLPVDYRIPNRQITIPLMVQQRGTVTFEQTRKQIQQKVGLFQREGGHLKRVTAGGTVFADVTTATLKLGGNWIQANRSADVDAALTLEAIPDFYGNEIQFGDHVEATNTELVFTETGVKGDYPGRVRVVVDNDSNTEPQRGLLWGLRSRYYDSSAPLTYEAEALTPLDAATVAALTGASGGSVINHPDLAADWTPVLSTGSLGHKGTYRVWARVHTTSTQLVTPELRLLWDVGGLAAPHDNPPVSVPLSNNFYIVNLGEVRFTEPFLPSHSWQGVIQGRDTTGAASDVSVDKLWLEPMDDASGVLRASTAAKVDMGYLVADELTTGAGALTGDGVLNEYLFSGPRTGATIANDTAVGNVDWTGTANVAASDGSYATGVLSGAQTTRYLKSTNMGFALPAGAQVTGIVVEVERKQTGTTVSDNAVRLVKAGAVVGNTKAIPGAWQTSDTVARYGSSTDMWGTTWSEAEVEASGFGVAFSATHTQTAGSETAHVDRIGVTVYYTDPQTWAGAGDADDFTFGTSAHTRTAVSDADLNTGRYAVAGTQVFTDAAARILTSASINQATARRGVLHRYTDTSNWLWGGISDASTTDKRVSIIKRVAGTVTTIAEVPWSGPTGVSGTVEIALAASAAGYAMVWVYPQGQTPGDPAVVAYDSTLATGGALDDGRVGFYDAYTAATAATRTWFGFAAWVPNFDVVIPAGGGSVEVTTAGMFTRTSGGQAVVSNANGRLPRLPPAGIEGRTTEVLLKPSRGDFGQLPDTGIDDVSAQVFYRPSWLFVAGT